MKILPPPNVSPAPAHDLPDVLWQQAFAYGTTSDLAAVMGVSRRWRALAQSSFVSHACLFNTLGPQPETPPDGAARSSASNLSARVCAEAFYERGTSEGPLLLAFSRAPVEHSGQRRHLALSLHNRWLGVRSGSYGRHWAIYDLQDLSRSSLRLFDPGFGVGAVVFAPNETWVASLGKSGNVKHYHLMDGLQVTMPPVRHLGPAQAGAYSADSQLFASVAGSMDAQILVISLSHRGTSKRTYRLAGMGSSDHDLAFSADASTLVLRAHYGVALLDLTAPEATMAPRLFRQGHVYPHRVLWTGEHLRAVVWGDLGTTSFLDGVTERYDEEYAQGADLSSGARWDTAAWVSPDVNWVVKGGYVDDHAVGVLPTLLFDLRRPPDAQGDLPFVKLHVAPRAWLGAQFAPAAHRLLLINDAEADPEGPALYLHDLRAPLTHRWSIGSACGVREAALTADGNRAVTRTAQGGIHLWRLPAQPAREEA